MVKTHILEIVLGSLCNESVRDIPALMSFVGLAGKGDQGVQNPGGQMDRPVNVQFLERSVQIFYTVILFRQKVKKK